MQLPKQTGWDHEFPFGVVVDETSDPLLKTPQSIFGAEVLPARCVIK